ncbi:MFS transporter [Geovibrio thiophilus]|uniref:MFS transporter n=1 Tax=Geovibrio thiophilus TaxID=139438 RepID=A0A3R5YZP6_9BACT|nr:MFS transporter [Geovibrio thiophilus]QAR33464.1 MFS transporter [Geovibrio thiophilus]
MENRKLFTALFIINFCITLGYGVVDSFFSLYVFELGARGALLGVPLAFYSLAKIFFSVPAGNAAENTGAGRTLVVSVLCFCCVSAGYLFAESLVSVIILRIFQGAACAAFRASVLAVIGNSSRRTSFASVSGTFDMSFYGALGAGPLIGGAVRSFAGFEGVFILLFALCIISLFFVLISGVGKLDRRKTAVDSVDKSFIPGRRYCGLLSFIFFRACGIASCAVFLPLFIEQGMKLGSFRSGVILCVSTVFMTFSLRPMSMLGKVFSKRNIIVSGGMAVSVMYMLIPHAADFPEIIAVCAGTGLFGALSQPACTAALLEEGERLGMGKAVGVFNLFMNMGFAAGPLAGSLIYGIFGLKAVFIVSGLAGIAGTFMFLFLAEKSSEREAFGICEGGYASTEN